jgi:2-dehydro-3-deoxyphosphogalactonate aldolase
MTVQQSDLQARWQQCVDAMPLIAILRGVQPTEALQVGEVLIEAGFTLIEVPLNSPEPYQSISTLADAYGGQALVGAGTVLTPEQAHQTLSAGGKLIVAPDFNEAVAESVAETESIYCPGVATPSEAFKAIRLGANGLKLFPAEMMPPAVVKALRAVLPPQVAVFPVGGINPDNMASYLAAGASGFGIGSALYKPGKSLTDLRASAQQFVQAYRSSQLACS